MLIGIKQIRKLPDGKPGTDVVLGKGSERRILQFRPLDAAQPDKDHACDVTNPDDVAQLLSIKEGFHVHASELKSRAKAPKPTTFVDQPAAGRDAKGAALDAAAEGKGVAELSRKELVEAVTKKLGKKPNPATSTAKLREILSS
jgi:hypothetical protein